MQNFRVTIDPHTAHDSYSHWRENQHDDLLLSLAMLLWWGESHRTVPSVAPVALPARSKWVVA